MNRPGRTLALLLTTFCLVAARAEPIIGADISHLPQLEAAGAQFYDHDAKAPEDLLRILKRNGFNRIRLKVWNEPGKYAEFPADQSGPEGYNNPAHVVAMAKRAQAAGLQVMIDFHYSDWWADPAKQYVPVAWETMTVPEMTQALADFTRQTDFTEGNQIARQRLIAKARYHRHDQWQIGTGLLDLDPTDHVDEHILIRHLHPAMAMHHRQQHGQTIVLGPYRQPTRIVQLRVVDQRL